MATTASTVKTPAPAPTRKKPIRTLFGDIHEVIEMPNLIEVQRESYEQFLRSNKDIGYVSGLEKTLRSVFPIRDFAGTAEMDFVNYELEDPKYNVEECRQRGITYAAPMKVTLRLIVFEVDPETGRVDVIKIWMVADHGVVLNPLLMKGQINGGVVQQLGGTLYENLEYDADGIPLQKTLKEYGMPTVWAAPEIHIEHRVSHSPSTRIGAKGGGEDGCIATSTVLMGAVEDALRPLGVKVMSSPLSPSRVRAMVKAAQT